MNKEYKEIESFACSDIEIVVNSEIGSKRTIIGAITVRSTFIGGIIRAQDLDRFLAR